MSLSGASLSRGGWALTVVAGLSVWFIAPHASSEIEAIGGADFPRALLGLASLAQLAISAWVIAIVGLAQVFGASSLMRAVTPRVFRGALFAGTAGVLAISPAHADHGVAPPRGYASASVTSHDLTGLPFPDRPESRSSLAPTGDRGPARVVVVRPGDTLWAIARRSLPAGSSDAEIARSCAAWFAANRDVIGNDPNLILPHQRLQAPTKEHS